MIDIVDRLKFDAVRCEAQFSKGVAGNIDEAVAEIGRLRRRNATLIEALKDHRCPVDGRALVGECQQCGCLNGLLIRDNERI